VAPDDDLRRIVQRAFPAARIDGCDALSGGISARATVVDVRLASGEVRRIVVRRPACTTPEETRRVVAAEHAVLERCAALAIPAPSPSFLDLEAAALGVEHVEGAPDFAPSSMTSMLEQMANELARIHAVPVTPDLAFLRRRELSFERDLRVVPESLDEALDEARIRSILADLWPWEQHNPDTLLHGDYWPGNLLWKNGKLAAVLDWEEAEVGDPLADLAVSRLDLLWAFGESAMHEFTERYRERRGLDWRHLARWDLAVTLRPMSNLPRWASSYAAPPICRPDITEQSMRDGHRRFVAQALTSLGMPPASR
jgi:aminoglycoside phosphotransferase (APT) family kinase protein